MNVLELRDVSRAYRQGEDVLRGIDLTVTRGEVIGLLGRNGAGKTTLLRLAMGLLEPQTGTVRVLDRDPRTESVAVKEQVGHVSEDQTLPGFLKVQEVIDFHRRLYPTWDDDLARDLSSRFHMDAGQRIKHLSKGQARQVALLCAVAHRPPLLLLALSGAPLLKLGVFDHLPLSRGRILGCLAGPQLALLLAGFVVGEIVAPSGETTGEWLTWSNEVDTYGVRMMPRDFVVTWGDPPTNVGPDGTVIWRADAPTLREVHPELTPRRLPGLLPLQVLLISALFQIAFALHLGSFRPNVRDKVRVFSFMGLLVALMLLYLAPFLLSIAGLGDPSGLNILVLALSDRLVAITPGGVIGMWLVVIAVREGDTMFDVLG